MSNLKLLKLNKRGDTIIEVMIVVAILGLAFASSYSIAHASIAKNRAAQEHTEALQHLSSQVELLRSAEKQTIQNINMNQPFCFQNNGQDVDAVPGGCNVGFYELFVIRRAGGVYLFEAGWDGGGGLERQRERIVYRQHVL